MKSITRTCTNSLEIKNFGKYSTATLNLIVFQNHVIFCLESSLLLVSKTWWRRSFGLYSYIWLLSSTMIRCHNLISFSLYLPLRRRNVFQRARVQYIIKYCHVMYVNVENFVISIHGTIVTASERKLFPWTFILNNIYGGEGYVEENRLIFHSIALFNVSKQHLYPFTQVNHDLKHNSRGLSKRII